MVARTRSTAPRGKKASGVKVDFSDTEASGIIEEGDYLIEVDEVEQKDSSTGNPMLVFTFKITEGDFKGKKLFHNCSLQPQALFNLRGLLEALGMEVPQGVMEFDTADLIGETCGASVVHELYDGKTKARIGEFFSEEDLGGEEAGSAAPAAKPAAGKKAAASAEAPAAPTKKKKVAAAPAEPGVEVGSAVTFTDDDGNEVSGEVVSIEGENATVKVGIGKKAEEWELELGDLTLAD